MLCCCQVLYNGSQTLQGPPTTTAWASAWLQNLDSSLQAFTGSSPLIRLTSESRAKLAATANFHPAVSEVLRGLALVPGMQFVLQCTHGLAYARILAQADLGVPLGSDQVFISNHLHLPLQPLVAFVNLESTALQEATLQVGSVSSVEAVTSCYTSLHGHTAQTEGMYTV